MADNIENIYITYSSSFARKKRGGYNAIPTIPYLAAFSSIKSSRHLYCFPAASTTAPSSLFLTPNLSLSPFFLFSLSQILTTPYHPFPSQIPSSLPRTTG